MTVAIEDKKDQASSKSSASTSLRGKAKADSSTPACSAEGRSKAASSISADLRASSSPGTPSEPTVPSISKKRKAPSKQLAEQPTKKRSRTVPQTDELVASGELNKESLPDLPPPETTTSTNVSDGSSTLTPPEDIPLPNLPECNVCWETGKEYVQTCAPPQLTCTECLQHALAESLNSKHIDQIDCPDPGCSIIWTVELVRLFATEEQQATFLQRKTEADPAFRRCLNPGCGRGRIYTRGATNPEIVCRTCKFAMCFNHRMAWHKGQTCAEYDAQQTTSRLEEEKRRGVVKVCPRCGIEVMKNGGCDHMQCTCPFLEFVVFCGKELACGNVGQNCRFDFCWRCLADYHAIWRYGNHYHRRSCPHWRDPGLDRARVREHEAATRAYLANGRAL